MALRNLRGVLPTLDYRKLHTAFALTFPFGLHSEASCELSLELGVLRSTLENTQGELCAIPKGIPDEMKTIAFDSRDDSIAISFDILDGLLASVSDILSYSFS